MNAYEMGDWEYKVNISLKSAHILIIILIKSMICIWQYAGFAF